MVIITSEPAKSLLTCTSCNVNFSITSFTNDFPNQQYAPPYNYKNQSHLKNADTGLEFGELNCL